MALHEVPQARLRVRAIAALSLIAFCLPVPVFASGQMPILPSSETFPSHQACVASLEARNRADREQARPKQVDPDGNTLQVELFTEGVVRIGNDSARYDAELWFHHGAAIPGLDQVEVNHSYVRRRHLCDREILKVTGEQGYTSSTFEPLTAIAPAPQRFNCRACIQDQAGGSAVVVASINGDSFLLALPTAIELPIHGGRAVCSDRLFLSFYQFRESRQRVSS